MNHFPIYVKTADKRVCIIGNSDNAVAKARLVGKSEAVIEIYADAPDAALKDFIKMASDSLIHQSRDFTADDIDDGARLPIVFAYLTDIDQRVMAELSDAHIPYCVIDNLAASRFTTPALIDRAPLTIAIGTEGQSPVLARRLKRELEERLPQSYGALAKVAGALRAIVAKTLPPAQRRHFWARYFDDAHPQMSEDSAYAHAKTLFSEFASDKVVSPKTLWFVSAGPGSADLLTMQARRLLDSADVVLHDRLVSQDVLELCRREADIIEVGKTGFGDSWQQADINALLVAHAKSGRHIVRLKSGDATIFGRLDEEIQVLHAEGLPFEVAPGITSASAGAAIMGASLTKRGRNKAYRILTGHDVSGFADYDWHEMATSLIDGRMTASVYMSVRAAPYMAGRLLMHGAPAQTKVTIAENITRTDERWLVLTLAQLPIVISEKGINGPAIIYLGLTPHEARFSGHHPAFVKQEAYYATEQA